MRTRFKLAVVLLSTVLMGEAQQVRPAPGAVKAQISTKSPKQPPAVLWLVPLAGTPRPPFPSGGPYKLLQKGRAFTPHLQIVPVGAVVEFPNADPFFHNVFSLFDGKRFDLGLYESGSSKAVTFSREGISYIFCNIHPEMSAVVISLSTALFSVADAKGVVQIKDVPNGDYEAQVWIEGAPRQALDAMKRRVRISGSIVDLGLMSASMSPQSHDHLNKFGQPYPIEKHSEY